MYPAGGGDCDRHVLSLCGSETRLVPHLSCERKKVRGLTVSPLGPGWPWKKKDFTYMV